MKRTLFALAFLTVIASACGAVGQYVKCDEQKSSDGWIHCNAALGQFSQDDDHWTFYRKDSRGNSLPMGFEIEGTNGALMDDCFEFVSEKENEWTMRLRSTCPYCGPYQNNYVKIWFPGDIYAYFVHPYVSCKAEYLILFDGSVEGEEEMKRPFIDALGKFIESKRDLLVTRAQDISEITPEQLKKTDVVSDTGEWRSVFTDPVRYAVEKADPKYVLIIGYPNEGQLSMPDLGDNSYALEAMPYADDDKPVGSMGTTYTKAAFGRLPFPPLTLITTDALKRWASADYRPEGNGVAFYDPCYDPEGGGAIGCPSACDNCIVAKDFIKLIGAGEDSLKPSPEYCQHLEPKATGVKCSYNPLDTMKNKKIAFFSMHGLHGEWTGSVVAGKYSLAAALDSAREYWLDDDGEYKQLNGLMLFTGACWGASCAYEDDTWCLAKRFFFIGGDMYVGTTQMSHGGGSLPKVYLDFDPLGLQEGMGLLSYLSLKDALSGMPIGKAVRKRWEGDGLNQGLQLYGDPAACLAESCEY